MNLIFNLTIRNIFSFSFFLASFLLLSQQAQSLEKAGDRDLSFGTENDGTVRFGFPDHWEDIWVIKAQPDGKILAVGTYINRTMIDPLSGIMVMRLFPDGTPDPSFTNNPLNELGITLIPILTDIMVYEAHVLDGGKILIFGYFEDSDYNYGLFLARLLPDGSVDSQFNGGGLVTTPLGQGLGPCNPHPLAPNYQLWGLHLDPNTGDIQAMGLLRPTTAECRNNLFRITYDEDGFPDTSITASGVISAPTAVTWGHDVLRLRDGGILLQGRMGHPPYSSILAKYTFQGILDPTFGNQGSLIRTSEPISDSVQLPDGNLVLGGIKSGNVPMTYYLEKYDASGRTRDRRFGTQGRVEVTYPFYLDPYKFQILRDSKGRFILASFDSYGDEMPFTASRHFPNGRLDPTFGDNGLSIHSPWPLQQAWVHRLGIDAQDSPLVAGTVEGGANEWDRSLFLARLHTKNNPLHADLRLRARANPPRVAAGQTVNYEVVIGNRGPEVAPEVAIDITLPPDTKIISTRGASYCKQGRTRMRCFLGDLNQSQQAAFYLSLQFQRAGDMIVDFSGHSGIHDPDFSNNETSIMTRVISRWRKWLWP